MTPKRVAFIIDDGPHGANTAQFLDAFRAVDGKASFSYIGRNVDAYPELARLAVEAGHDVMNHSYTHPHLPEQTDEQIVSEIQQTQAAILRATGILPKYFWIPFGEFDDRVLKAIEASGTPNFFATEFKFVGTDDWNIELGTVEHIYRKATEGIEDRTVILAHEWPAHTVIQIHRILEDLKAAGCEFLALSEFGV